MSEAIELRLVLTTDDYERAVAFYRDTLGLDELARWEAPNDGHVTLLDAGRATLEIMNEANAVHVDDVEVGRRVAGAIRVAFQVADATAATERAAEHAEVIAAPTRTPWNSLNARLSAPGPLQLTLFSEFGELG